jgi:uncharacterized protein Yka (UPF0111/DUF47 family)
MAEIEQRGDALRGKLVMRLAGVLVTPIDREDLFRLSRSIDDVLDNLRDFVREWDIYGIEADDAYLGLIDATTSGLEDLRLAVQTISKDPSDTSRFALVCKKSANEIRREYDVELGRLFNGELTMEIFKVRELLRRLDVVGLRLNEAADVLADAAVKRRA